MKILQINAVYKTKSTGRIVMEMHNYFKRMGHKSYVAYANENTDTSKDPNVFRVGNLIDHKLHAVLYRLDNMQGCHSKIATRLFLKKVKKIKPDIILAHNLHSNFIDMPYFMKKVKNMGVRVAISLQDCWYMTGGCYHYTNLNCNGWLNGCKNCQLFGKAAEKKYAINCEVMDYVHPDVVAVSKWMKSETEKSLLSGRSNINMIYNWVDRETFYPRENLQNIRNKYNITGEKVILGVSTAWTSDKGQPEMERIAKLFPDVSVVLVGKQEENTNYPDNVILIPFTDSKDELAELYSVADVFFNPTLQETFGLVSAEALSCGTPIVVYNTTACPEFVEGNTGIVLESKDDLEMAIKTIFNRVDELGKETISKECAEFVANNFNLQTNIQKYLDLFSEILSR